METFDVLTHTEPGLRSRIRDRSCSRSESTVLAGVWFGAGVGKMWPTPTSALSRRLTSGDRIRFWTDDYAPSWTHWKTERKGGWQCADKFKTLFSDRIPSDKLYRINLQRHNDRCITVAISSKTVMPTTLKGIGDNYGRLHPQFCANGCRIPVLPVWVQWKGKSRKWLHHIAIFRMELFLLGGVEADSELESESIFPDRSRSRS